MSPANNANTKIENLRPLNSNRKPQGCCRFYETELNNSMKCICLRFHFPNENENHKKTQIHVCTGYAFIMSLP